MILYCVKPSTLSPSEMNYYFSAGDFYDNSYWNDFRVNIDSDGNVVWAYGGTLSTLCVLDVRRFPFDSQECEIEFINWAYTGQFEYIL